MSVPCVIGCVLVFGVILIYAWAFAKDDQEAQGQRRQFLSSRPVLSIDDWYRIYFKEGAPPRDLAVEICTYVARAFGCDTTQIYPTDRFDTDLRLDGGGFLWLHIDGAIDEIWDRYLWRRLGRKRYKRLWSQYGAILTVQDLVTACDRVLS